MAKNKKSDVLVHRRARRGRPRKGEADLGKIVTKPVFVTRDPQGIKLFAALPKKTVLGLWEGKLVNGTKPMDPRVFVTKFRNARLPGRGGVLETRMGV